MRPLGDGDEDPELFQRHGDQQIQSMILSDIMRWIDRMERRIFSR
jgi:hypothetical protein